MVEMKSKFFKINFFLLCFKIKKIFKWNYKFNIFNTIPLLIATLSKRVDIVKLILSKPNVDINYESISTRKKTFNELERFEEYHTRALCIAAKNKNVDIVRLLVSYEGIDPNCKYIKKRLYKNKIKYYSERDHLNIKNIKQ